MFGDTQLFIHWINVYAYFILNIAKLGLELKLKPYKQKEANLHEICLGYRKRLIK
jgi:hypothetical protein